MLVVRLLLAVLHNNENSQRQQATTTSGEAKWKVGYSKDRGMTPVAKPIKTEATYGNFLL